MCGSPDITAGTARGMCGCPGTMRRRLVRMRCGYPITGPIAMVDGCWWKGIGANAFPASPYPEAAISKWTRPQGAATLHNTPTPQQLGECRNKQNHRISKAERTAPPCLVWAIAIRAFCDRRGIPCSPRPCRKENGRLRWSRACASRRGSTLQSVRGDTLLRSGRDQCPCRAPSRA